MNTSASVPLYHELLGSGPPLVLIPGVATDAVSWIFQREPLSAHYRLVLLDNRGVGRSPVPPGPYSTRQMARDIVELLDRLELEKVHVLGHSMGGAIAQHLALEHPSRVDRLVLACTFARSRARAQAVLECWAGLVRQGVDAGLFGRCLFPWLYSEQAFDGGFLEGAIAALRDHPYPLDPVGLEAQVAACAGHDTTGVLASIACPTLVLAAEADLVVPHRAAEELARGIPSARLEVLPGAGHSCMLEAPALFNRAVLEFLA